MKKIYQIPVDQLATKYLNHDFKSGLTSTKAKERLAKDGPNILSSKQTPKWKIFLRQFNNIVIYVLLLSALLTLFIGHYTDAIVILAVVIINSLIGYFQETSAANALAKIKDMLAQEATVYRDGVRQDILASDLVKGDIVFLEAGDNIPADLRILTADNLRVEEASLTGETTSVSKNALPLSAANIPLAERTNMVYASTSVTAGSGLGLVTATANDTEIGKISREVAQIKSTKTPLIKEIDGVGKIVSYISIVVSIIIFAIGWALEIYALPALALAVVAMLVGAIPEGLPATTSVILAFGVSKLAKKHKTIIKAMPAVETLGSVNVIATDKTGTLTKNEMTVTDLFIDDQSYHVTGNGYRPEGNLLDDKQNVVTTFNDKLTYLLEAGYQANDSILNQVDGKWEVNGEATDGAFLTLYHKLKQANKQYRSLNLLPFDSDYRYIARLVTDFQNQQVIFVKGSPDKLIAMAQAYDKNFDATLWTNRANNWSQEGKRVIALGYKPVTNQTKVTHDQLREGIIWLGLAALQDPPREEVVTALKKMNQAGVAVKMITGDHPKTAQAIGKQLGLAPGKIHAITGQEWDQLSPSQKQAAALDNQVFARTTPQNKLEIITALQQQGQVTAMTGDGINDAPALKKADIGIAMGIKGTDVAKDAADMILADDNFATMATVIKEGRKIYANIKKSILFLLPTSFAEGLIVAFSILTGQEIPLQPAQLLWINLVSAITIQFAFVFEQAESNIMNKPPRTRSQKMFSKADLRQMALVSVLMATFALIGYEWFLHLGVSEISASTMVVNTIVISKIFYFFSIRTDKFALSQASFENKQSWWIIGLMLGFQLFLTYVPFMQTAFKVTALSLTEWSVITVFSALILIIVELKKFFQKRK
ncbi:HAD-IC family P-type ATPase [Ligilactobacillus agilis]|uniref:HAD-IC family P-type ATPase n=1 Tax=Ligilactobacillus agilis TaxID=1601 RepID=UPI0025A3FA18|nr:HAD-IC family P-type ATPase [Ligilactobacillus agilis]MDM8280200.1 HAD-IC family P-type ATPase [Ligilactobacillus agilis]